MLRKKLQKFVSEGFYNASYKITKNFYKIWARAPATIAPIVLVTVELAVTSLRIAPMVMVDILTMSVVAAVWKVETQSLCQPVTSDHTEEFTVVGEKSSSAVEDW